MVAASLFPLTLAACLVLAWRMLASGLPTVFVLAAAVPASVVCIVAEHWLPHERTWRPERRAVVTDATHAVVSQFGGGLLAGVAVQGVVALVAPVGLAVWPAQLSFALQVALALVVTELGQYAWHRGCHSLTPLWRLHATHHSTNRLYWLAGSRFHPLDVVIMQVVSVAPVALAGATADVLVITSVIGTVVGTLQHANVEMRLGPLDYIFSGPRLHRWHHSIELAHQRANFGGGLIVWDIVFGTRHAPAESPRALGLDTPFPTGYLGQLAAPIRWNAASISGNSGQRRRSRPGQPK